MSSINELTQFDGPSDAPLLILAHGAGAGMAHEFFNQLVVLLSDELAILRFNFPYMQRILAENKRRVPDRLPTLIAAYQAIIPSWPAPVFIGGKSMGGRVASHVALTRQDIAGVVALGFPFHPPGKPERSKGEHLQQLTQPLLVLQGERDPFGCLDEQSQLQLPDTARLVWVKDGDHSFKPRSKSGVTLAHNMQLAADQIKDFVQCYTP
ncbi:alpha/beta family hydrolase [Celerinatantimonas yamalensis]|uniref:Alpha/beta family hydrolase n=1 Tax=Celerinatantimonas yamalensis TaxID=559956 RepID=A0ABW9G8U1_9GAMM